MRRPRGRPNRKQHGSPRGHGLDSQGPEGRIRGNAPQIYERYLTLARDAATSGDRVAAESHYQHAEHYFRVMNDSTDPQRAAQEQHRSSRKEPYVNREQPHVEWPAEAGGGNGQAAEKPEPVEPPVDAQPAAPEEEKKKPARRAAKPRQRTRRRSANGAKDPAGDSEDKADAAGDENERAEQPDDSDSAAT